MYLFHFPQYYGISYLSRTDRDARFGQGSYQLFVTIQWPEVLNSINVESRREFIGMSDQVSITHMDVD